MPYVKRSKKYKKKSYRRRRKANPRRALLSGFPIKKLVKMRYVDTGVNLDAPASGIAQVVYRANSVFDPYEPIGGHQPMSFDQWALIYNKYTVLGAKITMEWTPLTVVNFLPGRFGILLSSDTAGTAPYSNINSLLESKLIGNYKTFGILFNANQPKHNSVSKTFSAKHFFGKRDVVDGSANTALVTTNPGNEAFFIPWVCAQANAQDPGVATFMITIDYIVMFTDPKQLDGS